MHYTSQKLPMLAPYKLFKRAFDFRLWKYHWHDVKVLELDVLKFRVPIVSDWFHVTSLCSQSFG